MEIRSEVTEIKQTCANCDCLKYQNAGSGNVPVCPLHNQSCEAKENYVRKPTLEKRSSSSQFLSPDLAHADTVNDSKEALRDFQAVSDEDEVSGFSEKVRISCRGVDVEIDFQACDNIYVNEIGTLQLNYSFRITSQEDYQFCIRNSRTNEETSYEKIIGEGSFLLDIPSVSSATRTHSQTKCQEEPRPNHEENEEVSTPFIHQEAVNHLSLASAASSKEELTSDLSETKFNRDSSCETIEITLKSEETSVNSALELEQGDVDFPATEIFNSDTSSKVCSNCSQVIENETICLCLFGHDSCWKCKGKPCILCLTMMGESKSYCKNHHKGCTYLETPENLIKHEIDCELNSFRCPFPRCVFLNTLSDLKLHFLNCHTKSLVQGSSVLEVLYGRKDRKWYLYCYDSLFVCSYYYYGSHIEFILQYIGANDKAKPFLLEVEIKTVKEKKLSKRVKCAGWNEVSLCKGVCYDLEDLTNCDNSRFQFTANLKVVNLSNGGLYPSL